MFFVNYNLPNLPSHVYALAFGNIILQKSINILFLCLKMYKNNGIIIEGAFLPREKASLKRN